MYQRLLYKLQSTTLWSTKVDSEGVEPVKTEWELDNEALITYYASRIAFIIAIGDPEELRDNRLDYEQKIEQLKGYQIK